jgi:hypothetical protein
VTGSYGPGAVIAGRAGHRHDEPIPIRAGGRRAPAAPVPGRSTATATTHAPSEFPPSPRRSTRSPISR